MFFNEPQNIQNGGFLSTFIEYETNRLLLKIEQISKDRILDKDTNDLIQQVMTDFPRNVNLIWANIEYGAPEETKSEIYNGFSIHEIDASCITIKVPIEGDSVLLHYTPNPRTIITYDGFISSDLQYYCFKIIDQNLKKELVEKTVASTKITLDKLTANINSNLLSMLPETEKKLRNKIEQRKKRINEQNLVFAELNKNEDKI